MYSAPSNVSKMAGKRTESSSFDMLISIDNHGREIIAVFLEPFLDVWINLFKIAIELLVVAAPPHCEKK
jgi:hypothetical protein